jgi:hypothetical protein
MRGELTLQAAGRLIDSRDIAIDALRAMAGADTHDAVRLGAAKAILEMMLRIQDVAEIRVMLESIQKRLRETNGGNNVSSQVDQEF